jgi:hypothetical protein
MRLEGEMMLRAGLDTGYRVFLHEQPDSNRTPPASMPFMLSCLP